MKQGIGFVLISSIVHYKLRWSWRRKGWTRLTPQWGNNLDRLALKKKQLLFNAHYYYYYNYYWGKCVSFFLHFPALVIKRNKMRYLDKRFADKACFLRYPEGGVWNRGRALDPRIDMDNFCDRCVLTCWEPGPEFVWSLFLCFGMSFQHCKEMSSLLRCNTWPRVRW